MSLGDKFVALGCALIAAGYAGYEVRDREAQAEALHCSAWLEDGRPLVDSIIVARDRVLCTYAEPPRHGAKGKRPWT